MFKDSRYGRCFVCKQLPDQFWSAPAGNPKLASRALFSLFSTQPCRTTVKSVDVDTSVPHTLPTDPSMRIIFINRLIKNMKSDLNHLTVSDFLFICRTITAFINRVIMMKINKSVRKCK